MWSPRAQVPPGSSWPLNIPARRWVWSKTAIVATTPPASGRGRMLVAQTASSPPAQPMGTHWPSPPSAGWKKGASAAGACGGGGGGSVVVVDGSGAAVVVGAATEVVVDATGRSASSSAGSRDGGSL